MIHDLQIGRGGHLQHGLRAVLSSRCSGLAPARMIPRCTAQRPALDRSSALRSAKGPHDTGLSPRPSGLRTARDRDRGTPCGRAPHHIRVATGTYERYRWGALDPFRLPQRLQRPVPIGHRSPAVDEPCCSDQREVGRSFIVIKIHVPRSSKSPSWPPFENSNSKIKNPTRVLLPEKVGTRILKRREFGFLSNHCLDICYMLDILHIMCHEKETERKGKGFWSECDSSAAPAYDEAGHTRRRPSLREGAGRRVG